MIKHKQNILINSDINKVWFYLNDLPRSLIFDKYYKKINVSSKYSINNELQFSIHAKYLFHLSKLDAKILNCTPPQSIVFEMTSNNKNVYNHIKKFTLVQKEHSTLLYYENIGSFNSIIINTLFFLLIKSSCVNEIKYLKKAIESSDIYYNSKEYKPAAPYKL